MIQDHKKTIPSFLQQGKGWDRFLFGFWRSGQVDPLRGSLGDKAGLVHPENADPARAVHHNVNRLPGLGDERGPGNCPSLV